MKNLQKGFVVPILIVIGILVVGAIAFYFSQKSEKVQEQTTPLFVNDTKTSETKSETVAETYPFKVLLFDGGAYDSTFLKRAEMSVYQGTKFVTAAVIMEGEIGIHTFSLPAGNYTVSVKSAGYAESRLPITVREVLDANDAAHNQLGIGLIPLAQTTDPKLFQDFVFKKYKFSHPSSWKVTEINDGSMGGFVTFVEGGLPIAVMQCPIVETEYTAWEIEREKRSVVFDGHTYPIEWRKLTTDEVGLPNFGLILMNIDFSSSEFAKSCQLRIEGKTYDPAVAQKIFESVSVVK